MKEFNSIRLVAQSNEEILPDYAPDFPYIASLVNMSRYFGCAAPWHWHNAVELFYVQSGGIEYHTPGETCQLYKGSGGIVNQNVLHATRNLDCGEETVLLLHLFDPVILSAGENSRVYRQYVQPFVSADGPELVALDREEDRPLLEKLALSFQLEEAQFGYEFRLCAALSEIWLGLFEKARPILEADPRNRQSDEKLKEIMRYAQDHLTEAMRVEDLALAAHVSKRVCFRLFQEKLHVSPVEYIRSLRLQEACRLLATTAEPITQVGYACGLGSASYFGQVFRQRFDCTPAEYRRKMARS